MAGDHKEVRYLRLHLKEPGTERLRKTADGWLRHHLSEGWRETSREKDHDFITVRLDREGHKPRKVKIKISVPEPRDRRGRFGGPGGRFGGPGGRFGGPGGRSGPPGGTGAPGASRR